MMKAMVDTLKSLFSPPCMKKVTWDYRVLSDENGYSVREVYYENDVPKSWLRDCAWDLGEPWGRYDDLKGALEDMLEAFDKPMLTVKDGKILCSCEAPSDD